MRLAMSSEIFAKHSVIVTGALSGMLRRWYEVDLSS